MALTVALVPNGIHHAVATGSITVGAGFGEVPALGLNQLMQLRLPFIPKVFKPPGYEDQFYILVKSLDSLVQDVRLDAVQFAHDNVSSIIRLRVDIVGAPAATLIWLEAHHSVGR